MWGSRTWDEARFTERCRPSLRKLRSRGDIRYERPFTLVIGRALGKINCMSLLKRRNPLLLPRKALFVLAFAALSTTGCVGPNGARFAPVMLPSSTLVPDGEGGAVKKQVQSEKLNSVQVQLSGGARNYNEVDGTSQDTWQPHGEASVTYLRQLENSNIDIGAVAYSNFVLSHGAGFSLRWKHRKGKRWVIAPGFSLGWAWGGMNFATALRLAPKHWVFADVGAQLSGLGPEMRASIGMVHRLSPRFSLQYGLNQRMAFSVHGSDYRSNNPSGSPLSMLPSLSVSPVIHF